MEILGIRKLTGVPGGAEPAGMHPIFIYIRKFSAICLLVLVGVVVTIPRAEAYYLKKIALAPVENESGSGEQVDPARLVRSLLTKKINKAGLMILDEENGSRPSPASASQDKGSVEFPKHPAQLVLKSRILEFKPGVREKPKPTLLLEEEATPQPQKKLEARARIAFELINGYTGRPFWKETLEHESLNGDYPIGGTPQSLDPDHPGFYRTAMGQVLDYLTSRILERVFRFANNQLLEGQIVSLKTEDDETWVFVNLGALSGVEVGDSFRVYRVSSRYLDPYNQQDLGHWYNLLGAIRIRDVQPGFAIGVVRAGEAFSEGDVVQALVLNPVPQLQEEKKTMAIAPVQPVKPELVTPAGPFARPVRKEFRSRSTITHFDLFDTMKFTLAY